MTEQELIEQHTNRVAEVIADTDVELGYWRRLNESNAGAGAQAVKAFYVRMAVAALSVLAPMLAERDAQIETLTNRAFVDELPEPIDSSNRVATWQVKVDGNPVEFTASLHWDDNSPVVETDFAIWGPDELRAHSLAGLAAARFAEGLAVGSGGDGETPGDAP